MSESNEAMEAYWRTKRFPSVCTCIRTGTLVFFSGHGCEDNFTGEPLDTGRLGAEITTEQGAALARECGLILIDALQNFLGSLDRVESIVHAFVFISSVPEFYELDTVADGFSDLLAEVFGDRGIHTRMVGGTSSLPFNIPIEIEIIVNLRD